MHRTCVSILFVLLSIAAVPATAAATNTVPRQQQSADGEVAKFDRVGKLDAVDVDSGEVVISGQKLKVDLRLAKALNVGGQSIGLAALKPGGLGGVRFADAKTGTPMIVELKQLEKAKP